MPKAIPNPIQEAAAAIVALINRSPRSPRQDEIEAIVAEVAGPASYACYDEALAVDRATWRKLVLETEATTKAADLLSGDLVCQH